MQLREATAEDIPGLTKESKKHFPTSLTIHGLLDVGYRLGVVDTNKTKLYIPKDENAPLFIFAVLGTEITVKTLNCFWDTSRYSDKEIKSMLGNIPDWDWTEPMFCSAIAVEMLEKLKIMLLGSDGLAKSKLVLSYGNQSYAYSRYQNMEDEQRYSAHGFTFDRIDASKAAYLHRNWKYHFVESANIVKKSLEMLPSVGAFLAAGSEHDLPVSWAVIRYNGEIGYTTTLPEYRKLGLATISTKLLANKCIQEGISNFILAGSSEASKRMHDKLGYKRDGLFAWQFFLSGYERCKIKEDAGYTIRYK